MKWYCIYGWAYYGVKIYFSHTKDGFPRWSEGQVWAKKMTRYAARIRIQKFKRFLKKGSVIKIEALEGI